MFFSFIVALFFLIRSERIHPFVVSKASSPSSFPVNFPDSMIDILKRSDFTAPNRLQGSSNAVVGTGNTLSGDFNRLIGKQNGVIGHDNSIFGTFNAIGGSFNQIAGT